MEASNIKNKIREIAQNRCGYCLSQQRYVMSKLEIEHIFPKHSGGNDDEENLWLSCGLCNRYKATQTKAVLTKKRRALSIYLIRGCKIGQNILSGAWTARKS